jgi:DNA-directed RNA polymerase specialized sigma24 family protein
VLVLRYEENLSYQEIAKLIDEDPRVVGTRLHRAKKMLAERLAGVNEI